MDRLDGGPPQWRQSVNMAGVELALMELGPLLEAVAATGSTMLIKVDGERNAGANPPIFTVVTSGGNADAGPIRFDDSDLIRAVSRAIAAFDTAQ